MIRLSLLLLALFPAAHAAAGTPAVIAEPSQDRWMYPSNGTPGLRSQASTFSALPEFGGVDDRWGFFLFAFDTGQAVPAGLPPEFYRIRSVRITSMIGQDNLFAYDPTYDEWRTYATPSVPASSTDGDAGRPLELHGAGFRNGATAATFLETSGYGGNGLPGTRSAFPLGFDAGGVSRDVSGNVTGQFESIPWAVGQTSEIAPGDPVPEGTTFGFQINTELPGVNAYLREGLAAGRVWFSLSSLHPATEQAGEFAAYYTKDDFVHHFLMMSDPEYKGGIAPTLELEVDLVFPLAIEREGNSVALHWPEFAGLTFKLQASPDLSPGSWEQVHSHAATAAGTGGYSDAIVPGKRFYRLAIARTP